MKIKQQYIIKNDCYKENRKITPRGIMVHSTATPGVLASSWYSRWNKPNFEVAVHAFLDDTIVCQHLPWNHRAWHAGGAANNTHIGFEICEPKDWKTNEKYFKAVYTNAVELTAYLCQQYKLTEKDIISHKEGHSKGIASNHGDPDHWWKYFGYNMTKFRADVKKALAGGKITVEIDKSVTRSTVQSGSKDEDVKYLQTRLNKQNNYLKLSYKDLETDGNFGAKTKAALIEFQKARKLTADGIAGEETWAAIEVNYGDVNGDGRVDSADAMLVLKNAVGKNKLTTKQKLAADMNADGKVDSADAMLILKRAVGK